jgi:hypothetical protein
MKMKVVIITALCLLIAQITFGQNFFQLSMNQPKCFNACDGNATYASTLTSGPFTAVITNTGSCPNSTVQSSSGNTITLSNLCACATDYTISFFNSSNILVGTELLQIPVTATAALILQTPTLSPATCPSCCNGEMFVSWSGGYVPTPNNPTITLDGNDIGTAVAPYSSVCVGSHTLCVEDLAGCKVCTTFSMSYVINVGLNDVYSTLPYKVYPNPFDEAIRLEAIHPFENIRYTLLSSEGKVVSRDFIPANGIIETKGIAKGLYFLELTKIGTQPLRVKMLKQ